MINWELVEFWWRPCLEILAVAMIFYYSYLFLRGTGAYQVLKGMVVLLIFFVTAKFMDLNLITFILSKFFGVAIVAMVVLFQPEIRRGFAALGRTHFRASAQGSEFVAYALKEAIMILAQKQIGALIAVSRENSLRPYIDTGIKIDALPHVELFMTIFMPKTPLHDGAVIIDGDRAVAASCLLPLSQKSGIQSHYGTRHRAAIGLSEETDAIVLVVSEETGKISVASGGKIREVDEKTLKRILTNLFHREKQRTQGFIGRVFQDLLSSERKTSLAKEKVT